MQDSTFDIDEAVCKTEWYAIFVDDWEMVDAFGNKYTRCYSVYNLWTDVVEVRGLSLPSLIDHVDVATAKLRVSGPCGSA